MFCPNCGYEYNPGIYKCPDCNVALVKKMSEIKEKGENFETAVLTTVESQLDGQVLVGMLESESVECFLRQNYIEGPQSPPVFASNLPFARTQFSTLGMNGWGVVVVNKSKIEKAREVLKDFEITQGDKK